MTEGDLTYRIATIPGDGVGPEVVDDIRVGQRVAINPNIFCGSCYFCRKSLFSNCHNTNPEATAVGAIYGYSHTAGGYDGGQAEYVRVPLADVLAEQGGLQVNSSQGLGAEVTIVDSRGVEQTAKVDDRGVAVFEELWARRTTIEVAGAPIDLLAMEDLVRAK